MSNSKSRRRILKLGVVGCASLFPATVILGVSTARAADKRALRVRVDSNPAYAGKQAMEEFLPPDYGVEWIDLGNKSMSAFVAMQRRLLDFNSGGYTYLITSYAEGQPIVCISGLAGEAQRVVVRKSTGIKSLAEIKGRKVATAKGSSTDIKFVVACKSVGIDADKDVERFDVGGMPGVRAALESGKADVGVMWEPNGSQIIVENPNFVSLDTLSEKSWVSQGGMYVLQPLIDSNRDDVQAVVTATVKGILALRNDRERWLKIAEKASGLPRATLEESLKNCRAMYEIPLSDQRACAEWMYKLGLAKKDVSKDIHKAVNYDFLMAATGQKKEQLGWVA